MRMEAWVEGDERFLLTGRGRLMEENPNFLATAPWAVSFELVGQMAAPGFDSEFILHRAGTNRLIKNAYGSLG